jgi:hypothetical protein
MTIMANQSANKVGSIKLPNGCHTQAGIETLRELYRVHFPGAYYACLAIKGAMTTTPTAAMEVLLGLPPLHVATVAEAQAGIYRLMCNQQWRPRSTKYGHVKVSGHGARTYPFNGD